MKKFLLALATSLIISNTPVHAAQGDIVLPTFSNDDSLSVTQALAQRKSTRNFLDRDLTTAQLAKILWAANGFNRPAESKRVNPAALGVYSVEVYAVTREGVYVYDAAKNTLKLVATGDYRSATTTGQSFVSKVGLNLVYVENPAAWDGARRLPPREAQLSFANISVGAMVQSVALAAQTEGLGNCVRGSINREDFKKIARLPEDATILLAQSVGFVK